MKNWFNTLNDALSSENLIELWPIGTNINYDETVAITSHNTYISVHRDARGMYERPVHYHTQMENGYISHQPSI